MPLVDLKTDLKSLSWGRDRRGGGSSNQPYISKDLPEDESDMEKNTPDFILRNGLRGPATALEDVSRMTQMFFDTKSPNGLLFTAKQNLLSRTSVQTQVTEGQALNQGVYTPLQTIAQAGINLVGGHLEFMFPTSDKLTYSDVVKNNQPQEENRLFNLSNLLSPYRDTGNTQLEERESIIGLPKPEFSQAIKDNINILKYSGGPGSKLGIGNTFIKFADQRTGDNKKNPNYKPNNNNFSVLSAFDIQEKATKTRKSENRSYPEDFRKGLLEKESLEKDLKESFTLSISPDYITENVNERTHRGDPGKKINVLNYGVKAYNMEALDKITALEMYEDYGPDKDKKINDLVKFRIAAVNNDSSDGKAMYMHFRAFIDDFSDSYNAKWNSVNYVGRGDTLYNYSGFDRSISLGFTVAAQSKAELIPMYKKLNYLASTLTPNYTTAGFMRGNIVRLTIGGYLYEQEGIITSLTYTPPKESPWEIAIDEKGNSDDSVKELPHIINVTGLTFIPIHNFLPERANNPYAPNSRYIALSRGKGDKYNNYDNYEDYKDLRNE
jgi:hypothetical protein